MLELIERGTLNLKSNSFKSLPQSLSEIYHLAFSILFPSSESYETVSQILSIALVQLQPVSLDTLFAIFSALHVKSEMNWNTFQDKYGLVSDFLVTRTDGTLMFFHSTFRDWLTSRRDGESSRYLNYIQLINLNTYSTIQYSYLVIFKNRMNISVFDPYSVFKYIQYGQLQFRF